MAPKATSGVTRETAGIVLEGYIAALAESGPRRGPQNVFINGRLIRDKTIAHAIGEAYAVASIRERSPEVHLFIEMPLDAVDVNVHPSKAEVRFREQSLVHEVIRRSLADALGRGPAPALVLTPGAAVGGGSAGDAGDSRHPRRRDVREPLAAARALVIRIHRGAD